jgi:hypothetical protein
MTDPTVATESTEALDTDSLPLTATPDEGVDDTDSGDMVVVVDSEKVGDRMHGEEEGEEVTDDDGSGGWWGGDWPAVTPSTSGSDVRSAVTPSKSGSDV